MSKLTVVIKQAKRKAVCAAIPVGNVTVILLSD